MSLNIERDKHYARWQPFVRDDQPDVLCLQEVYEADLPMLADKLGLQHTAFTPLTMHGVSPEGRENMVMGQAILSRTPLTQIQDITYYGQGTGRDVFDNTNAETRTFTSRYALLQAEVKGIKITTTHMVWTPNGEADDHQRAAITHILNQLQTMPEFVLCGDFNAPRGKETFSRLAEVYTDNIPPHYTNSIDKTLHRAGAVIDDLMVDGLFTTPHYKASNVQLHSGLSDHMAITAEVTHA